LQETWLASQRIEKGGGDIEEWIQGKRETVGENRKGEKKERGFL